MQPLGDRGRQLSEARKRAVKIGWITRPMTEAGIDFDRLLKLRLVVARFGEMDIAKWWNTRGQLGRLGAAATRRGFPTFLSGAYRVRTEDLYEHLRGVGRRGGIAPRPMKSGSPSTLCTAR